MVRSVPRSEPLVLLLDPGSDMPLYRQIYLGMRQAMLDGRLAPGSLVPSTRALARDYSVSRTTVLQAYDQLLAEGLLEGVHGAGTRVADLSARTPKRERRASQPAPTQVSRPKSRRARAFQSLNLGLPTHGPGRPFRVGEPALDGFPLELWRRLYAEEWRQLRSSALGAGDPVGSPRLRQAIAASLSRTRAARVSPEQVLIVRGSQQGIDLVARVLLDPGDTVWMEEPGYFAARAAFAAAGATVVAVPVDVEGLQVDAGIEAAPSATLAYVTPSHQFPLGMSMTLPRRMELLRWANTRGSWVLEDDYDAEFQYEGRPLPALQGLDEHHRVVYVGTFSKTVFPALRMGYLVVPPDMVEAFSAARQLSDQQASPIDQAVLARFIEEGYFSRHVQRMQRIYRERRDALLELLDRELHDWLHLSTAETGLHLVAHLPPDVDDVQVAKQARERGVDVTPLSFFYSGPALQRGLLFGFACGDIASFIPAISQIQRVLTRLCA
jgi:GntR family transcriptional regulator/MocR family aminotransferase